MISFISGGARSGKSKFAEEFAVSAFNEVIKGQGQSKGHLYYVATAKRSDAEMKERIQIHREMRIQAWETVEEPYDLTSFLSTCDNQDVVLVDCVTIWLNNVMFTKKWGIHEIEETVNRWLLIAKKNGFQVVFVSNDVNEELPHISREVQQYTSILQHVHKMIVSQANKAIQITAGLPTYWKGET